MISALSLKAHPRQTHLLPLFICLSQHVLHSFYLNTALNCPSISTAHTQDSPHKNKNSTITYTTFMFVENHKRCLGGENHKRCFLYNESRDSWLQMAYLGAFKKISLSKLILYYIQQRQLCFSFFSFLTHDAELYASSIIPITKL